MNERLSAFVDCIHGLGTSADNPIESVLCKGGGLRVIGFKTIRAQLLLHALDAYGKICVCHTANNEFVIDCYDDTSMGDANDSPIFFKSATEGESTIPRGAITETSHNIQLSTSQQLRTALIQTPNILNIIIAKDKLVVQTVTTTSAKLANGLHDQLQRRSIKFRRIPQLTASRTRMLKLPKSNRTNPKHWKLQRLFSSYMYWNKRTV